MLQGQKRVLNKSEKVSKIIYLVVRIFCIIMIAFGIVALCVDYHNRKESRYVFIMIQAVCMFSITFVPLIVEKCWKIAVPVAMELLFLLFCGAAFILGEICEFYIIFKWWDDLLHAFSGCFIACIGFVIISVINAREDTTMRLSPGFIAFFAFILSLACECVWEMVEYAIDYFFKTNMQRFVNDVTKEAFIGRQALRDTMVDIILVFAGSLFICIVGYLDMKLNKSKFTHYFQAKNIRRINTKFEEEKSNIETEQLNND